MSKIYTIAQIKDKLLPIFKTEPVYRAILFGSYATGEATEKSDVDIIIDSHGELVNMHFYGVLEDIAVALEKKIDLIELVEISPNSPIFGEIQENGVLLYER